MKLIGLIGTKGSGKDEFYKALQEEGWHNIKMADPLKNMLRALYRTIGLSEIEIERRIEGDLKETPDPWLQNQSPRYAMQTLGTEWRNMIGMNLWSTIWNHRITTLDKVICTDIRFQHETEVIKHLGGKLVKIERPGQNSLDTHISETEMGSIRYDILIKNDGSLEELHRQAKMIGKSYGI